MSDNPLEQFIDNKLESIKKTREQIAAKIKDSHFEIYRKNNWRHGKSCVCQNWEQKPLNV